MVEYPQLTVRRADSGTLWVSGINGTCLGWIFVRPRQGVPYFSSSDEVADICLAGLVENSAEVKRGLWVAGIFRRGSAVRLKDVLGRVIGGWQGEWIRIMNHPAGRVLPRSNGGFNWHHPDGRTLAHWNINSCGELLINLQSLREDQGFCRLLVLLRAVQDELGAIK